MSQKKGASPRSQSELPARISLVAPFFPACTLRCVEIASVVAPQQFSACVVFGRQGTFQAIQSPPAAALGGLAINCAVQPHLQAALPSRRGQSPWASLLPSLTLQLSNEVGNLRQTWPFNF